MTDEIIVDELDAQQAQVALLDLIGLLQDTVAGDASIGFLEPPSNEVAEEYWHHVIDNVAGGACLLLVARKANDIVGAVQLALEVRPNGSHRAEVQKLMVLQSERRQGIGKRLMQAVDDVARRHGRALLVLDTRQGDAAEQLYRQLGYIEAGVIPQYALSSAGTLDATIYFYRLLQ